jgi:hypothetical protein
VVEIITEGLHQGFSRGELVKTAQIAPLIEQQIKQYKSTYGDEKFQSVQAVVQDVLKRHQPKLP